MKVTTITRTNEQGEAALAGSNGFSLISTEKLLQIYTAMVKCRGIEERVQALSEKSEITGAGDAAVGQEAVMVGVAIDLGTEDTVFCSHPGFLLRFIQDEPMDKIFGALFARAARQDFAAQLNLAMSVALANKTKKNGKITMVFCDDRAASLESWREALHAAGVYRLPIIFVRHSNLSLQPGSLSAQSKAAKSAFKAPASGFPSIAVDGSDVVAVYRVATESIAQARKGNGATLIECVAGCRQDHAAISSAQEREAGKAKRWMVQDPIRKMEEYLSRKGIFSEELKVGAAAGFTKKLDAAIKAARTRPS